MTLKDILEETYIALSANKVRSGLTVLGIVIGISSVIAMVSIGQGAQGSIQSSIQSIGSNLLLVSPGAQRGTGVQVSAGRGSARTLTQEDAEAIQKEITSAKAVAPELSGRYQVTSKGKNTNTSIVGTVPAYPGVRNLEIDEGSFITEQHVRSLSKVAVIGPTVRTDLFGEGASVIGTTIRIKGIEFKIIGVTRSKGGSGFNNPDDAIYVPLSTAMKQLFGATNLTSIAVEAKNQEVMTQAQNEIGYLLLDRHNKSDPTEADFSIFSQSDILNTASSVTSTFTTLLGGIAAISLLVGGIGIMNIMLVTVTERTREIGLRKALGAKKKIIITQFLIEAILLTVIGGFIGMFLGIGISYILSSFMSLPFTLSVSSILLAIGVSGGIGILFGWYPAKKAADLQPIEALRYE